MTSKYKNINSDNIIIERINDHITNMVDYDDHEHVFKISYAPENVIIFIAVHDTTLGPSIGGFRFAQYSKDNDRAITDALRLARGMTQKNSAAGLDHGGGKSVAMAYGANTPNNALKETMAHALNQINTQYKSKNGQNGIYYTAEDVGMGEDDIKSIASHSDWVVGAKGEAPDPSPQTARGVVQAIKEANIRTNGTRDLSALTISIQGLGGVGMEVARILYEQERVKKLIVADMNQDAINLAQKRYDVTIVDPNDIYDATADLFCPCAMGAILTTTNIDRLHAAGVKIVCGAANNQIPDEENNTESQYMMDKGMLYVPDFIGNSGGVIWVAMEHVHADPDRAPIIRRQVVQTVSRTVPEVFALSDAENIDMATAAVMMAQKRIENSSH